MTEWIEQHIAAVEAHYELLITGSDSRLEGGGKLWGQFTNAVKSYRERDKAEFSAVIERVNELAVARILLGDPTLTGRKILYEPQIAADDHRKIDFVVPDVEDGSLYIEVKTVRPIAKDPEQKWKQYEKCKQNHTENVSYIVGKERLGAQIYGNSFSARTKFMDYTRKFEPRLAEAVKVQPGRSVLVFCGTGWEWHRSELEDFADFYLTGRYRQDDPFATMEAHEAFTKGSIAVQRNIVAFGFVKRPIDSITEEEWIADVRGPHASPSSP
ncbi:MAG: hypothetical protein WBG11_08910 [Methylocella sp.]